MIELFFYPIVTFLIALIIVFGFYIFAGGLEPKPKKAKYKQESYACGEEYPETDSNPSYDFFHVAFFFTVLHVGALLLATAPLGPGAFLGIFLIGAMALTAYALYVGGGMHVR